MHAVHARINKFIKRSHTVSNKQGVGRRSCYHRLEMGYLSLHLIRIAFVGCPEQIRRSPADRVE
jgi:hypothetical protein